METVSEIRARATELMEAHLLAKKAGDYAKSDEFYAESLFCIKLLKAAGEELEGVRG